MIQKIESIKNIGNFEDYKASGDVSLKRMNFIYAENGAGKTTLSRILQSLGTNSVDIIEQHHRIGTTDDSYVSIKTDNNSSLIYNGKVWNKSIDSIEVFDSYFVAENVYSGFQVSSDNRKNLYRFILGNAGIKIAEKIERVKKLIDNNNDEIAKNNAEIKRCSKNDNVEEVLGWSRKEHIDDLIKQKEKELEISRNERTIWQLPDLPKLQSFPLSIDINEIKRILSISIEDIGKEYLEIVKSHIDNLEKNGLEDSSQWIYKGFDLLNKIKKDECPFCGGSTKGVELIEGYNLYFTEKYRSAIKEIEGLRSSLCCANFGVYSTNMKNTVAQIKQSLVSWKNFVDIDIVEEEPSFDFDICHFDNCFKKLRAIVDAKLNDPVENNSAAEVDEWSKELQKLSIYVEKINSYVERLNGKIEEFKKGLRKEEDVNKELTELKLNKDRFEGELSSICKYHELMDHQSRRLQKINTLLQEKQKAESSKLFKQYGQKINYYLKNVFNTKFQITEVKDAGYKGKSKEATLNYKLTFNGEDLSLEGNNNTSFRNVLSEGDKNTIAISFFIAKITMDSHLCNKVIVFDDPLTSLDLNRRNSTISQLILLYQECEQLIVLSHNLHFLMDLFSRKQIKKADKKVLQIVWNNGKSQIVEYELSEAWINKYQKALKTMENFVDNSTTGGQEEAIGSIRISLETFLKLKYCKYISRQDFTFGQIISELEKSACVFVNENKKEVIDKLIQLNEISWRVHHGSVDENEVYSEISLSSNEALTYVNMTLDLLCKEL